MFETDSISKPGGRESNEDYLGVVSAGGATCFVVADGLGGHRGGHMASQLAVSAVLDSFQKDRAVSAAAVRTHLFAAHETVVAHQSGSERQQMQSTIVLLITDGRRAIWGHVGDSRLYLIRNGRIIYQTQDHSVSQTKVSAGLLPIERLRFDVDRNKLLQSAGQTSSLVPTVLTAPVDLNQGDAFLLCVDGFWEKVFETEMEIDLAKAASAKDWLRRMAYRVNQRLEPQSDNFTAVVVRMADQSLPVAPVPKVTVTFLALPHHLTYVFSSLIGIAVLSILMLGASSVSSHRKPIKLAIVGKGVKSSTPAPGMTTGGVGTNRTVETKRPQPIVQRADSGDYRNKTKAEKALPPECSMWTRPLKGRGGDNVHGSITLRGRNLRVEWVGRPPEMLHLSEYIGVRLGKDFLDLAPRDPTLNGGHFVFLFFDTNAFKEYHRACIEGLLNDRQ